MRTSHDANLAMPCLASPSKLAFTASSIDRDVVMIVLYPDAQKAIAIAEAA